jgi:predicted GTPase
MPDELRVNIAIIGAVSTGKSTLLNSLFVEQYSDMRIKRTTMVPQVYHETGNIPENYCAQNIMEGNRLINNSLIEKTESKYGLKLGDITEIEYYVPKIYNFVRLRDSIYLSVYDIPGLNDSRTKDVYYQYLMNNFNKFDIIIFIVDVTTAFNTMDEINILDLILKNIDTNKSKYDIDNSLVVLVNKCDDIYPENGNLKLEPELEKMFEQANVTIKSRIAEQCPSLRWNILPISCENSFIYRIYKRYPSIDLDVKFVNKVGCIELGKTKWNTLSEPSKKKELDLIFERDEYDNRMEYSGFNRFKCILYELLMEKNLHQYITNRLKCKFYRIMESADNFGRYTEFIQGMYDLSLEMERVNNFFYSKYESGILELLNNRVTQYIIKYNGFVLQESRLVPRTEGTCKKYTQMKVNYENLQNLFPKIWNSEVKCELVYRKVISKIDSYFLSKLERETKTESIFKIIDVLRDNNYNNWKSLLIRSISSKLMVDDITTINSDSIISTINSIFNRYELDVEEMVDTLLNMLHSYYKREVSNIRNEVSSASKINHNIYTRIANVLTIVQFWDNIILSTDNRYYWCAFAIKRLLANFVNSLYNYDGTSEMSIQNMQETYESLYNNKIEKFTYSIMQRVYTDQVCLRDDMIKQLKQNNIRYTTL